MVEPVGNIPTILVIFGATGDLMAKKIAPALLHLHEKDMLPTFFKVVGVSRRGYSDKDFQKHILQLLQQHKHVNEPYERLKMFLQLFSYREGLFDQSATYKELAEKIAMIDAEWGVCSNKLFYLAVPPGFYKTIFKRLAASGLTKPCGPGEGWTRVIVEKPFGKDLNTAQELDALLGKLFREEQIYRIDHYLAKEMLQNILAFRFSNSIFEQSWNNQHVERIRIRLLESIGVEGRGPFYDGIGCLKDVGQNHMLQMLALVTMNNPGKFEAKAIRSERAKALQALKIPSSQDVKSFSFRAQYDGYRNIEGVKPNSQTETYFKIKAFLNTPRWEGTPIILESGKKLGEQRKEISVVFKHPTPCLCPPNAQKHYQNEVVFSIEPKEGITIHFWSKKPGLAMDIGKRTFDFLYREKTAGQQYVEEYEKLLLDCITGDQTLFVGTEEVKAMWNFIDAYVLSWEKGAVPLKAYKPNTNEPLSQSSYVEELPGYVLKKEIGIVGLGKMGGNIARRLHEKGWRVIAYNRTPERTKELEKEGIVGAYSLEEFVNKLNKTRLVWLMLPAGKPIDDLLFNKECLAGMLENSDIVIDGGNSFYKDAVRRYKKLAKKGLKFVDIGVSGGPGGARYGACLMVGGSRKTYEHLLPLFLDLATTDGVQFFESPGAGHFVKMVHNAIEYGMMQAIAEGFTLLKKAGYGINLSNVAEVYNHGSVIESRLIGWLKSAFELHGENLRGTSGRVGHTGGAEWAVKTAKEAGVKMKIIEEALRFRKLSGKNKNTYTGKILSALREQFGGHSIKEEAKKD